jgi:hypothetical protein
MKNTRTILLAAAVAAATGIFIFKWNVKDHRGVAEGKGVPLAAPAPGSQADGDLLSSAFDALRDKATPEANRESLLELRKSLVGMPADQAVAAIRGFLASGRDFPTGLPFDIAADGSLATSPTFRCFLLDLLAAIDASAAAATGREILEKSTTADEWALALRNVGRGEPLEQTAGFLQRKTEELIANPDWQAKPSIGYLNAFDVLVYSEAVGSAPLLSDLVRLKDRKDLVHAGFLTLDRLVLRRPVELLGHLASDRALRESRPEAVAQQFARADVRVPEQREILRAWLLDPARTPNELQSFASVYPNNNRFVSNNLLTADSAPSGADLARHDEAALRVVSEWAADPEFEPVRETLDAAISRLDGFVKGRDNPPSADE